MGRKALNVDTSKLGKGTYSDAALAPEDAHEVMAALLDYYVKLGAVVRRKVVHASDATKQRIADIEQQEEDERETLLSKHQKLDALWEKLIVLLEKASMSTEEFEKVNMVVDCMPRSIRPYYDMLVQMDADLAGSLQEMEAGEYRQHYEKSAHIAALIQKGRNLVSGLEASEYDLKSGKSQIEKAADALVKVSRDVGVLTTADGQKIRII